MERKESLARKVLPINRGSPPLRCLDTGGGDEEAEMGTSWHVSGGGGGAVSSYGEKEVF